VVVGDGGGGHPVEAGEEREVVVADVDRRAVLRRQGEREAGEGVLDPDPVLGDHRHQADGERQVEALRLLAPPGGESAGVALKEEALEVEVELLDVLVLDLAVDLVAQGRAPLVERADERVDALGGGDPDVEVEIEAGGDGRLVGLAVGGGEAVVVVNRGGAQVAVGHEAGGERVPLAQPARAGAVLPAVVEAAAEHDRRLRRRVHVLAAVDRELGLGVVGDAHVGGIGREGVRGRRVGMVGIAEHPGLGRGLRSGLLGQAGGGFRRVALGSRGRLGGLGGLGGLGALGGLGGGARRAQGDQQQGRSDRGPDGSVHGSLPLQRTSNSTA
jgi:hypothetical protein